VKATCHYHPHQPAYWYCPRCKQAYCQQCIIRRSPASPLSEQYFYHCPLCGDFSEFIGVANLTKPFWQRIPQLLRYPLAFPTALLMLATFLVGVPAADAPWTAALAANLSVLFTLAYAFGALRATARGNLSAPALRVLFHGTHIRQIVFQYLLFMAAALVATFTVVQLGLLAGIGFFVTAMASLPAIIIVLAATNSILKALNPIACFRWAYKMGRSYLLMVLAIAFITCCALAWRLAALHFMPAFWHSVLHHPLQIYFTIAAYHLMGYVTLQYQERIGFEADHQDLTPPLRVRAKISSQIFSVQAPAQQGAKTKEYQAYS